MCSKAINHIQTMDTRISRRELLQEILDFVDSHMLYDELMMHLVENFDMSRARIEGYIESLL